MAKIFETSFETESLIDRVSKIAGTNTNGVFRRTEKGLAYYCDGTARILTNRTFVLDNAFSIVCVARVVGKTSNDLQPIAGSLSQFQPFRLKTATNEWQSYLKDDSVNARATMTGFLLNDQKYHLMILTADYSGDVSYYFDNFVPVTIACNFTDSITLVDLYIGFGASIDFMEGFVQYAAMYDHVLTAQERADAYERFLKAGPRGIELYPKPVLPERKPTDLSRYVDTGLCLAHNMIPSSGNLLVDTSNQNAPGAIDGATEILEGLSFDGKDDSAAINLSLALAATIKTICFRIKLASTTEMILDGDNTGSLVIDTNAGTLQYPAYDNAFIDGVDTDTIFADQWTDVVITSSTAVDNNTPTLGRTTAAAFTYGKFEIADLQYWSNEWTLADAKKYHNSFVKPVLGRIPSIYDAVGSTSPFGCIKGTGVYEVKEITHPIRNINTVAWFDSTDLDTLTLDGTDHVSRWNDKLGSGHDLIQANGADQPLWSANGVLFDGVTEYIKTAPFAFVQPEMIYIVLKQVTWTVNNRIMDGDATSSGAIYQRAVTPQIALYAGLPACFNTDLILDTWSILRGLIDGVNSELIINNLIPALGDPGANNMDGFTLGADGTGARCSNIEVKEIILRNVVDDAATQAEIYNYLSKKYNIDTLIPNLTFNTGIKYLDITTAGLTSVPTKQAYGTWEGMIYKGDTANRLYMILIANKIGVAGYVQGYALNFDNDEGIYLEKYDGVGGTTVLFATAASYIIINTWYKYRFTKTLDGIMTLLLKGEALVPTAGYDGWTLAAPTGAYVNPTVADNTYKTCEYSVIDGGVLDRAIIDHTDNGVKQ